MKTKFVTYTDRAQQNKSTDLPWKPQSIWYKFSIKAALVSKQQTNWKHVYDNINGNLTKVIVNARGQSQQTKSMPSDNINSKLTEVIVNARGQS